MTTLDVVIKGVKPLMQHSTAAMLKPKSKKVKSSEHDPEEEARDALYLNEKGEIGVPSFCLLSAFRKSATQLKKAGSGKKTLKDFVFSGLEITPDFIVLPNQKYEIDIRPVVVQRARIMRARPVFKEWGLNFQVVIKDEQTWDAGTVRQVIEEAGKYQGLLEFRPLYGQFEITTMKNTESGKEIK